MCTDLFRNEFKEYTDAEIARFSSEQRAAYETSLKVMRDYTNTLRSAEEKGREEERILIAKSMLRQGIDAEAIKKITGVNVAQL